MKNKFLLAILAGTVIMPFSCKKFERLLAVATISVSSTTKLAKGEIIDVAGSTVEYGFCWGSSPGPTLADSYIKVGSSGSSRTFETTLSSLLEGDTYWVRAYIRGEKGTEYGVAVKVVIAGPSTIEYYWDDGEADYGWRYNSGYEGWMGNYFPISSAGKIYSIDAYFANFGTSPGSDNLSFDVFDASRNLLGSTGSFSQVSDSWMNISASINYEGAIYVMVHWNFTATSTNFLGMDQNGSQASMDLGYYRDGSNNWGKCSTLTGGNQLPGVFLLRIHVQLSSGKTVIFEPGISPATDRRISNSIPGTQAMDLKNRNND